MPNFDAINKEKPSSYDGDYHFIQSHDDYELFVRTELQNTSFPTLLFLTDEPSRANLLFGDSFLDSLRTNTNLVFPDYRAAGKSERFKSFSAYNLAHYAEDLKTIIQTLDLKHVVIVAQGFGALVSQMAMERDSSLAEKLIYINPTQNFDESAKRAAARLAKRFKNPISDDYEVPFYYEMHGYELEETVGFFGASKIFASMDYYKTWFSDTLDAELISFEALAENPFYSMEEITATHLPSATIGLMYSMYKTDYATQFKQYSRPTLVLVGEEDVFTDHTLFKSQADSLDMVDYFAVPKTAHFPYIENPNATVREINKFIHD
jgi:pimeloyl-ACP methyl ester carboxylesterase